MVELHATIDGLKEELTLIDAAIAAVEALEAFVYERTEEKKKKKRRMSVAGRKRLSAASRERWARYRALQLSKSMAGVQ